MQNGYIESFNGKLRDERLNEQWFETLRQARSAITHLATQFDPSRRLPPPRSTTVKQMNCEDELRRRSVHSAVKKEDRS
ncbi:transposase InsO family protein [Variovorax ginsengisoli]|uniref:Transposase InsO family protein n=1 Tax=Variovorax ginsengisoli TaxID=363844 RepID=A0ABT9SCS2_9BURK|nr:transposase InsO family protein [Variovorax ginsengisoli]